MKPRAICLLLLPLLLTACGDESGPVAPPAPDAVGVPSWAKVAPEQIAEAARHGVPVAFENDLGMRFVLIPAGTFLMGSPEDEEGRADDETQHEVTISTPFYMQITEVTNAWFRLWNQRHDSDLTHWRFTLNDDEQPGHVWWRDGERFVAWLDAEDPDHTYRLPTEAEWEYACRAGTTTPWYWGASFDDAYRFENCNGVRVTWSDDFRTSTLDDPDGHVTTAPVASYLPNPWGLHDLLGNMDEWCSDDWAAPLRPRSDIALAILDPTSPVAIDGHVVRSSFCLAEPRYARCASRYGLHLYGYRAVAGLRLVSPLPAKSE